MEPRSYSKHSSAALRPHRITSYVGAGVSGLTLAKRNKTYVTKREVACTMQAVFTMHFSFCFNTQYEWNLCYILLGQEI